MPPSADSALYAISTARILTYRHNFHYYYRKQKGQSAIPGLLENGQ